jgi:hypothetical protein
MRDEPTFIDRIAREAATNMIENAALAHIGQGEHDRLLEVRLAGTVTGAPQKFKKRGLRKFWRTCQATIDGVESFEQRRRCCVQKIERDFLCCRVTKDGFVTRQSMVARPDDGTRPTFVRSRRAHVPAL